MNLSLEIRHRGIAIQGHLNHLVNFPITVYDIICFWSFEDKKIYDISLILVLLLKDRLLSLNKFFFFLFIILIYNLC